MRRLLVARFHSMGDVVLASGVVERLIDEGNRVEVATRSEWIPIFEGGGTGRIWTPSDLPRAGTFDRIVDLQANASSRRVLRGHGPTRRCRSRSLERRWLVAWGRRKGAAAIPHAVCRYAEAAEIADRDARGLRPRVRVTDRDRSEALAFPMAWRATEGDCAALAVGASRTMKRWPMEHFEELAAALETRGLRCLRLLPPAGGAGEREGSVRAPLRPIKAILERCRVLVTNDSGIMHLGVGLGLPVVAIFGSTTTDLGFAPLGVWDRVVERELPCRPCAVHGAQFCWQLHRRCVEEILPEDVLGAALQAVGREGS